MEERIDKIIFAISRYRETASLYNTCPTYAVPSRDDVKINLLKHDDRKLYNNELRNYINNKKQ